MDNVKLPQRQILGYNAITKEATAVYNDLFCLNLAK